MENDFEGMRGKRSWRSVAEVIAALIVVSVFSLNLTRGDGWELDAKVGGQLIEWNRVESGERVLARAIERAELQGAASLPLATALDQLASSYLRNGRSYEAEPLLRRALAIRRKNLGDIDPSIADGMHKIGLIYRSQDWEVAAESMFAESLSIRESALGANHVLVSESLVELAIIDVSRRRFEEAEQKLQRASEIVTSQLGPMHPRQIGVANAYASLRREQGRFEAAVQYLVVALGVAKASFGTEYGRLDRAVDAIQSTFRGFALAERQIDRVAQQLRRSRQPAHPEIASLYNNLGLISLARQRYGEAEVDFLHALEIDRRVETAGVLSVMIYSNLGTLYENQGRSAEAKSALESALVAAQESLRPTHPLRFAIDQRLETMYRSRG